MRALKTVRSNVAMCGQNGAARSNGAARLNEVRQRVGRLARRGRQGVRQGVRQNDDAFGLLSCCAVHDFVTEDGSFACHD